MNPDQPQFEKFWRSKINDEIKSLITNSPEINAYGVYLAMLDRVK